MRILIMVFICLIFSDFLIASIYVPNKNKCSCRYKFFRFLDYIRKKECKKCNNFQLYIYPFIEISFVFASLCTFVLFGVNIYSISLLFIFVVGILIKFPEFYNN